MHRTLPHHGRTRVARSTGCCGLHSSKRASRNGGYPASSEKRTMPRAHAAAVAAMSDVAPSAVLASGGLSVSTGRALTLDVALSADALSAGFNVPTGSTLTSTLSTASAAREHARRLIEPSLAIMMCSGASLCMHTQRHPHIYPNAYVVLSEKQAHWLGANRFGMLRPSTRRIRQVG